MSGAVCYTFLSVGQALGLPEGGDGMGALMDWIPWIGATLACLAGYAARRVARARGRRQEGLCVPFEILKNQETSGWRSGNR